MSSSFDSLNLTVVASVAVAPSAIRPVNIFQTAPTNPRFLLISPLDANQFRDHPNLRRPRTLAIRENRAPRKRVPRESFFSVLWRVEANVKARAQEINFNFKLRLVRYLVASLLPRVAGLNHPPGTGDPRCSNFSRAFVYGARENVHNETRIPRAS